MQSSLPENPHEASVPPVPIKTYQWEDVRRARQQGGYPWTHLDKQPLQAEDITAESVLRDSTPSRRSMSREPSGDRSGGRSPAAAASPEDEPLRILMLDASPGSSRKMGEGEDEAVHVPNFSKEISLDSEEDILGRSDATPTPRISTPEQLSEAKETKAAVSPKGILKRKHVEKPKLPAEDSPRNSKCCHPFVEKIKHIADITMHKTDKILPKKDASQKKKSSEDIQEIIPLDCSPGSERRERQKLAELQAEKETADEIKISLVMQTEDSGDNAKDVIMNLPELEVSPSSRRRKEHIYEDIDKNDAANDLQIETVESIKSGSEKEEETVAQGEVDAKSGDSLDPSLTVEETADDEERINKIKAMYDISMTPDKLVVDIQNDAMVIEGDEGSIESANNLTSNAQERMHNNSPNITITDVTEDGPSDQHLILDTQDENMDENVNALDKRVHFDMPPSTSDPTPAKEIPPDDGTGNVWSKMSDHEYEPIGKPAPSSDVTTSSGAEERGWAGGAEADDASSTTSQERQFLRPEEDNEAFSATDGEPEAENEAVLLQKQIEDRFFVNTPTTTESRTDCEISTSQVDSSALEDLPLKRENRKKSSVALETSKLQQRIKSQTGKIRTQAGKLRTKLKTIKKPQFHMPERPKFERPKFNMPERPKFNMPERPKFNMPERPKFHMPERPKFNFPDKSKFRLPDRPKINLPDRPKFNFPDRPKFSMPDRSKFKLPDRPKLNFPTFSRNKDSNRRIDDENSTESTSGSKKHVLDFDFRTYPRIFSKHKKEKRDMAERPGTPPPGFATVPRMTRDRQQIVASKWEHASSRTDDEPRQYGLPLDYSEEPDFKTKLAQVDKDFREMQQENSEDFIDSQKTQRAVIENQELWNKLERNTVQKLEHGGSLPHILPGTEAEKYEESRVADDDESSAASTGQHRRGVLEEIDKDEFFLRQKGISQDNIEVGKYLSDEIRDAFRSPINALSQMDSGNRYNRDEYIDNTNMDLDSQENIDYYKYKDDDENDEHIDYDADLNHNETMAENDDGYYTFPPVRPSRAKKLKALAEEAEKKSYVATHIDNTVQLQNVNLEEIPTPEFFSDSPAKPYEGDSHIENIRKHLFTSSFKEPDMLENLNEYENEMEQTRDVPMIPKRRKKSAKDFDYSENGSIENVGFDRDDWMEPVSIEEKNVSDEIVVHRIEHIIPKSPDTEDPPALPQRTRSRSRGSRTTSLGDDDRTSRGAESITLDSHTQLATIDVDFMDDLDDGPGYAVVDKVLQQKKADAPPRPPAPMRRQRSAKSLSGERQFFTVPRPLKESTPPRRPLRNYSTLGPSRPPRKKSTTSLSTLDGDVKKHSSSTDVTQYVEIEDDDQDTQKGLKSGNIISKMKDRPLPPPPRPPRGPKKKKDLSDKKDEDEILIQSQGVEKESIFLCDENKEDSHTLEDNFNIKYSHDIEDIEDSHDTERRYDTGDRHDSEGRHDIRDRHDTDESHKKEDSHDLEVSNAIEDSGNMEDSYYVQDSHDIESDTLKKNDVNTENIEEKVHGEMYDQEEIIEIEVSTQTDPLPDDFDYDLGIDEPLNLEYLPDTITDFSKEEPEENSIDVEIMSKGLQKFKDSSRPNSRSSKPRTPIERPKTPLGRMSPTAILVERRVSSPTRINEREEIVTEASLTVQPIDEPVKYEVETRSFIPLNRQYPSVALPPQTQIWPSQKPAKPVVLDQENVQSSELNNQQPQYLNEEQDKLETDSRTVLPSYNIDPDILRTRRLQVSDLDVERLNVSELQANKILVSEIEGLSLQVSDLNSTSGHIFVRGIELAPGIIEEMLQKFSQLVPPSVPLITQEDAAVLPRSDTNQETQTEVPQISEVNEEDISLIEKSSAQETSPPVTNGTTAPIPERPPLPQIHPTMYPMAYYPEYSLPSGSFYQLRSPPEERHPDELLDLEFQGPATRSRRRKREPVSSSDEEYRPVNRRAPPARAVGEPSVSELSVQLFRACQRSVSKTVRNILSYITSHFGGGEDKKDVQMALVIFLVMIAGLIMLGVGDGRTVHHHHWDFFNPPNNEK